MVWFRCKLCLLDRNLKKAGPKGPVFFYIDFYLHFSRMRCLKTMSKRTKIICTIGPATESYSRIKNLYEAGMNVARLNMSHSDHKNAKKIIERIKRLNTKVKNPVGILLDTQGPEIRTGDTSEVVNLEPGELISFTIRDEADVETTSIRVHYDELIESVDVGTPVSYTHLTLPTKRIV